MAIWYLTADLMFSSRVEGVAQRLGKPLQIVPSAAAVNERLASGEAPPTLLLIDLGLWSPEVAQLVASLQQQAAPPKLVAYGPHVHEALLDAAQSAGCDSVLTRGQFDRQMAAVLAVA